jgi:hypothetical protein
VSKPFDSQQLLAQVEALLDRAPSQRESFEQAPRAEPPPAPSAPPEPAHPEPEPFDVGFSAEDFTAAVRVPPVGIGIDPFEEEYARGDVDSAIEAFEKGHPELVTGAAAAGPAVEQPPAAPVTEEPSPREPLAPWLGEEPEKAEREPAEGAEPAKPVAASDEPTQEIPQFRFRPEEPPPAPASESGPELSAEEAQPVAVAGGGAVEAAPDAEATARFIPLAEESGEPAGVPHEIEMLAQTASIPELNQMVSSVSKNGNELTAEQVDRIASRVVEKLSDRIVREIAWEVIPDMAEIVIKKRIKELESGVE